MPPSHFSLDSSLGPIAIIIISNENLLCALHCDELLLDVVSCSSPKLMRWLLLPQVSTLRLSGDQ